MAIPSSSGSRRSLCQIISTRAPQARRPRARSRSSREPGNVRTPMRGSAAVAENTGGFAARVGLALTSSTFSAPRPEARRSVGTRRRTCQRDASSLESPRLAGRGALRSLLAGNDHSGHGMRPGPRSTRRSLRAPRPASGSSIAELASSGGPIRLFSSVSVRDCAGRARAVAERGGKRSAQRGAAERSRIRPESRTARSPDSRGASRTARRPARGPWRGRWCRGRA